MKVTRDLTTGNIYKNFLLFTLPLIGSSLLSGLYSTVDAMIAGKFISEHALGAINATGSFDMIFHAFFDGFGEGFAVFVALLFGKKEYGRMKSDILHMLLFLIGVILLISGSAILFRNPIMDFLKVDPILRADTEIYFIIYTAGYLIIYGNIMLVHILQALGITSVSFYVSLISAVLNIGGNLLAVLVLDWGVAGLALSTLLSAAVSTVIYLIMLRRAFRELPSEKLRFGFDFSCVIRSLRYTLPAAVQKVAYHGVGFLVAPSINGLGADATTGYTVSNRIIHMCSQCFWCASRVLGCYAAQCVGAGKQNKIRRGLWVDLWLCFGLTLPVVLVFCCFAAPISSLFFPEGYAGAAFQYAVRFATFYLPFLFINMLGHLIHTYLRGLGAMNVVFWVSLLGSAARLTATLLLVPTMSMEGVFAAILCGWIADSAASALIYLLFYRTDAHIERAIRHATK